jgi:hypothetical protein
VYNGGPEYDVIVRESTQPVRRLRLDLQTDVAYEGGVVEQGRFRNHIEGDTIQVIAPQINVTNINVAPPRVSRKIERVQVNRGWQGLAEGGQTQQLRAKMKSEARPPR